MLRQACKADACTHACLQRSRRREKLQGTTLCQRPVHPYGQGTEMLLLRQVRRRLQAGSADVPPAWLFNSIPSCVTVLRKAQRFIETLSKKVRCQPGLVADASLGRLTSLIRQLRSGQTPKYEFRALSGRFATTRIASEPASGLWHGTKWAIAMLRQSWRLLSSIAGRDRRCCLRTA